MSQVLFGLIVFPLCVCVLCAHARVCVIILTPLLIGNCTVSIIITHYMQCVQHTGFGIFHYDEYIPCQNHM
jgi:ABC-type transport system involved in cytochrome c biogenesis permease component